MSGSPVIVAPRVRDLDILAEQLTVWLQSKLPQACDLRLVNLSYPDGAGRSHETILFDAFWIEEATPRSQGMVVRIKPSDFVFFPDNLYEEQIRVMEVIREQGRVKVARILWREDDPAVIGAPFFVMEKLVGRVAVTMPLYSTTGWVFDATPEQRRRMWENGVRQLAAIQATPLSSVSFLAGPTGLSGLNQEWEKYRRFLEIISRDRCWPILEAAFAELERRRPVNPPEGMVWGDARIGNMMFDENFEVLGVMDWEQPSLGGALHDLAWWIYMGETFHGATRGRSHLEGFGTREETIAMWQALTGKPTDDLEWFEDFTSLKLAISNVRDPLLREAPLPDEARLEGALFLLRRWFDPATAIRSG